MGRLRVAASVIGSIGGLIGVYHGYNETLQGSVATGGVYINAIGPPCQGNSCLPAMTLIQDFWITGLLAIVVGIAVILVAVIVSGRRGGFGLIALSVLLLLVGGGFLPPILGIVAGVIATRIKPSVAMPQGQKQNPPTAAPPS